MSPSGVDVDLLHLCITKLAHGLHLLLNCSHARECVNIGYNFNRISIKCRTWKFFPQIYLSSILRTYKVSRKLQNIYYYQEGIIMSWSKDKTRTQKHRRAAFLLLCSNNFLLSWIRKDITHLYQEKQRYNFVQSTFLSFFFSLQKQF